MISVLEKHKDTLIIGLIAILSCTGFLIYAGMESGIGFPLDDAWIHHTFARNLARYGEWSFIPGEPSGASTGPLWGALLSILYLAGVNPLWGNYIIGFLILWAIGLTGLQIAKRLLPESKFAPLLIGSLLVLEWHLVWGVLSGMETMLLGLVSLIILYWTLEKRNNWWIPGLMIGATIWIRPDGLTLVGPVLLSLFFRNFPIMKFTRSLGLLIGAVLILVIPYFYFNLAITGDIWPNTLYAKQAEYAFLYDRPLIKRLGTMSYQIVVGVGIALLPGIFFELKNMIKEKDWERIGIAVWTLGYIGIYSWRLPVAYQHSRYTMPVMPIIFVLGAVGLARSLRFQSLEFIPRVFSKVWAGIAAGTLITFWVLGARSYALDVGVINTEMVAGAVWIEQNTPEESIIAAHDVGALGYYGGRQIRDLAGLITPDVIPFLWEDEQLAEYLDQEDVDYLFTFKDWYPGLISGLKPQFQTEGEYAPLFGMENFALYAWK